MSRMIAITGLAFATAFGVALAAENTVTRKLFDRIDAQPGYETVLGSADFVSGASLGRHFHHGVEFGYVAAGELEILVDGQEPLRLKAGDFYKIQAGKIHDARSIGGPAKAIATWVVEKGKPLAEPPK